MNEKNEKMVEIALSYLFRGWSVIAVGPTKIPLSSWKEYQTRKPTVEEIVGWWEKWPDAQIGIVTGSVSNLTVIDVESDGDLDLIKDETYRVRTGGGGIHIYCLYEPSFKNAVRILPEIDIRSEGGYVVAAGSNSSKGPYTALNTLQPTRMSESTKKLLTVNHVTSERILPWSATSGLRDIQSDPAEALVYDGAGKGRRNDSMAKYAGSLCAKLHPSLWDSVGWNMFQQANLKNSPPLPSYELANTWKSIGQKERTANPAGRDYSRNYSNSGLTTWGPNPESKYIKQEEHKVDPKTGEILDADDSQNQEEDPKETLHVSTIASLQVIDSDHTYPLGMKDIDDALLGGFSAGEVNVVAGMSGHGKTSIIQEWSVKLAIDSKLPSLWFSYEVLARPLWEKFKTMGATEDTPIYMPRLNESGDTEWITEVIENSIEKWGIKVVCIDHLGFLNAPKGRYANAADSITHTVRALKRMAVKYGLIFLLPVHVRKTLSKVPDLNDIKDASGIAQEADSVFFIGREKDSSGQLTTDARLWLVKNRKSGIAVNTLFTFKFGRYFPHPDGEKHREEKKDEAEAVSTAKAYKDWCD